MVPSFVGIFRAVPQFLILIPEVTSDDTSGLFVNAPTMEMLNQWVHTYSKKRKKV
jgi:hypothetical protein